jgi:hypothetical protein
VLQVLNETPFVPGIFVFPDEQGVDTLYTVLKATVDIRGGMLQVASTQRPLVLADEYWGEPGASSLKYASEAHLMKPGTDVVLVGEAYAPRGKPVASCLASVVVGPLSKRIQVFGRRHWTAGLISPRPSTPEPFLKMPLTYERAFGGIHEQEPGIGKGKVLAELRNPVGRGFRGRRGEWDMLGQALPNLEDPRTLIRSISDTPEPMGTGCIAPSWMPRRAFGGTYDEDWQTQRAPYLPLDFKPDFFRVASSGLSAPGFLVGGEPVELVNTSPESILRFRLPRCELDVSAQVAGRRVCPPMRMELVLLEPGEGRLCLLWRGAVPCDKQVLKVEKVRFQMKSFQGLVGGT